MIIKHNNAITELARLARTDNQDNQPKRSSNRLVSFLKRVGSKIAVAFQRPVKPQPSLWADGSKQFKFDVAVPSSQQNESPAATAQLPQPQTPALATFGIRRQVALSYPGAGPFYRPVVLVQTATLGEMGVVNQFTQHNIRKAPAIPVSARFEFPQQGQVSERLSPVRKAPAVPSVGSAPAKAPTAPPLQTANPLPKH